MGKQVGGRRFPDPFPTPMLLYSLWVPQASGVGGPRFHSPSGKSQRAYLLLFSFKTLFLDCGLRGGLFHLRAWLLTTVP